MQCLIILAFLTTAILANKPKRTDDANNVAALETLLQKQAVVIESLEARLTAQTVSMHSLQAELVTQQNTIDSLLENSQSLDQKLERDNQTLFQRLATQQNTIDSLLANTQSLDQKLERDNLTLLHRLATQQNTIDSLLANTQSLSQKLERENQTLAHRLTMMENVQLQQAASLQTQQATLQHQASVQQQQGGTLQTVVKEQQSMGVTIAKQEQAAGFYADFGYTPYQDVTNATGKTIKFPRVLTNTGNGYNNNTGIFTTPFSGLYTFQLHFMGGSHNDTTELSISAGGRTVAVAYAEGYYTDPQDQGSCTAVVRLVKGDQVSVRFYYYTLKIWGSTLTSFSGVLVQSD